MLNSLQNKFYTNIKNLKKNHQLNNILVALSGGQDSLCLIKLIQNFKKKYKPLLKIHYIYIDHQWKIDSKKQVEHIINLIRNSENISIYQIPNITQSENKARQLRYQIIIQHAIKYKYPIIITAHTETDKIETFLQQIIRGTSIDGATSMKNYRILNPKIHLWRPLLNFTRADIKYFCRQLCLPIWSDITNYNFSINRNRLRYEFIPYLNKYFCNNIEKKINAFLEISDLENEYIKQNAIKLYLISRHKYNIAINYSLLKKQHKGLFARTLQIFFYHNINKCLTHKNINNIMTTIEKIDNKITIIKDNNIIIKLENNWLYL
uniref:tRNA(Ile)-lysidine synthase n=1 Tax=Leiomenia cribrosa TaxID=217483 RepID=A0A4D6WXM1_9FLOR|nr:tRNA Ile-lysidine synthetase [Leiomenia cribrosa]